MTTPAAEAAPGIAEIAELSRLVADVAGTAPAADVPFATPLLFFARLAAEERARVFAPRPGRLLVQESLVVEAVDRIVPGEALLVHRIERGGQGGEGPFHFDVEIARPGGGAIASVKAGIAHLPIDHVVKAEGLPAPRLRAGESGTTLRLVPICRAVVDRWLRLVGDENPIHGPDARALVPELVGPIVPGALLAAAAEALVAGTVAGRLERLTARFAAPILLDEPITVEVVDRGAAHRAGCRARRLQFAKSNGRIAALMDLTINEGSGSDG